MISLDAQYSGAQLGRALLQDEEELAYAIEEISDGERTNTTQDIADYFVGDQTKTADFLRRLAAKIEGSEE